MTTANTALPAPISTARWAAFVLVQIAVMAVAISSESLWVDEFWTAHFAQLPSWQALFDLLLIPSGSQTPLHFGYYFLWGQVFPTTELWLRLANVPFFVLGQVALFWALRAYPARLSALFLIISALHPLTWQYANESRPYIMMLAGSQMMLAYILHLHAPPSHRSAESGWPFALFAVGGVLLFGASLLGAFWVLAASLYVVEFHFRRRRLTALFKGVHLGWLLIMLAIVGVLTLYYADSLMQGARASRHASSSVATVVFAGYELLGLSGLGPGRLDLREAGVAAAKPFVLGLAVMSAILLITLLKGWLVAQRRLDRRTLVMAAGLSLFPILIVVGVGFIVHWRVLGRHLIAALPVLCLLLAVGLDEMWASTGRWRRGWRALALACLAVTLASSLAVRFLDRHAKDDYRSAAEIAVQALDQGQRVWWAADYIGADYYRLPGEFDAIGVLTSNQKPPVCHDLPGIQAVSNLDAACLAQKTAPDLVIFSKPDIFDLSGDLTRFLAAKGYRPVQTLPAFVIWRAPGPGG